MYSTGCPSSSGSYSVLVPWSGGVSWALLRPTSEIFAVPPRAPEVAVHSAHWNRGYSLFLLLVLPQPRPVHSQSINQYRFISEYTNIPLLTQPQQGYDTKYLT